MLQPIINLAQHTLMQGQTESPQQLHNHHQSQTKCKYPGCDKYKCQTHSKILSTLSALPVDFKTLLTLIESKEIKSVSVDPSQCMDCPHDINPIPSEINPIQQFPSFSDRDIQTLSTASTYFNTMEHIDKFRQELSKPPRRPRTTPHTSRIFRVKRQTHQSHKTSAVSSNCKSTIRRIIHESPTGERTTVEHEDRVESHKEFTTLSTFKTSEELEMFVEQSTHAYESKLNEYAQKSEIVLGALTKWFDELKMEKKTEGLVTDLSMDAILSGTLPESTRETIVQWNLWALLFNRSHPFVPVLQSIFYYTIDQYPDGNRKTFHCKFSSDRMNLDSVSVRVPEVLLRGIPIYSNVIHAFFETKFIPFKKKFMNNRRQQELTFNSKSSEENRITLDQMIEEHDFGYSDPNCNEINPRTCYSI